MITKRSKGQSMVDATNLFDGQWQLVPELCQYQDGSPPAFCLYEISIVGERANFSLTWTDKENKTHSLHYGGPTDGTVVPYKGGHITEMSFSSVDGDTLDSSSYSHGREVNYTRRKASTDGALLSVQMVTRHNGDASTRNFQIFRRLNNG